MTEPGHPAPPATDVVQRTGMAAERTWLAWWRTALAATAGSLGVGRLAPELLGVTSWPYVVLGMGYAALAVGMLVMGARRQRELVDTFAPYETGERGSGEPSRWSQGRDLEWVALRPELVVEITFDHVSDGRIRHGAKVQRWRDDKAPAECRLAQLEA